MDPTAFIRAMIGGFIGTVLVTILMYVAGPLAVEQPVRIAGLLGAALDMPSVLGLVVHFVQGTVLYPILYLLAVVPVVRGLAWQRGAVFGVGLWLFGETVILPMIGAGFMSVEAGGIIALAGSLFSHLVYGVVLGVAAGVPPSRRPRRSRL